MTRFGPAGSDDGFAAAGFKKSVDMPEYLEAMGLTAYEYQCGHGVRVTTATAQELGANAAARGIQLSLHSPYYISLSSEKEETRLNSVQYILQSARAVTDMGGSRIVVHAGSCGKMTREQALKLAKDTLQIAQRTLDENGYGNVHICPETMGKVNQLGDLYEVMQMCLLDERFIPCIDFGHLNARTFGGIQTYDDFKAVLDTVKNTLGEERARVFHAHFSKIEYTPNGGEKRHLTFADETYGPSFEPLARLLAERGYEPTIICESAGTQSQDARTMQQMYLDARKEFTHESN